MTEDTIRTYALQHDLVDVKVCAVNEVWSGLKLVGAFQIAANNFLFAF